jgi:uncharacterized protein YhbP (UPF0306 family)
VLTVAGGIVTGTVQRDDQQWDQIQGVQLRGRCRRLDGVDLEQAWALYAARYSFVASGNDVLAAAVAKIALWSLEPDWMRLIDNRLGFGHKEEWTSRSVT